MVGPASGNDFRTKDAKSARAFLAEMQMQPTPERLPRTWWGRVGALLFVGTVVVLMVFFA